MKRTLLPGLILILFFQNLFAQTYNTQKGYIVTYENDTIAGLIKEQKDLSEKILFKSDRNTAFREYTPEHIQMFSYEGGYDYKVLQTPVQDEQSKKLFLLTLIEGPLSLYKGQDYFYVAKYNEPLARLEQKDTIVRSYKNKSHKSSSYKREDKRYIRLLNYLTSDCPSLRNKLEKVNLTAPDLMKFITAYNHYIDPQADTKVNTEATRLKLHTGLRIGMSAGNIKHLLEGDTYQDFDFKAETNYTTGLLFNLTYNDKISLQPELLITKKGGTYQRRISTYHEYADFSLTYLQLPLSLYYTWPTQGIRPFVSASGVIGYALSNKSFLDISGRKLDVALDKDEYGYRAGAGFSFLLKNNNRLSVEYIRERSLSNGIDSFRQIHFVNHHITMSMRF